ncbi:MAG: hypothetical protein WCA20_08505, partial [Candidatus Sulfotelmatobacter sp.]
MQADFLAWLPRFLPLTPWNRTVFRSLVSGLAAAQAELDRASWRDGNDPQRTAGAAYDFQWRRNNDGAGRRKLIK